MALALVTAPATEPLTLTEIKNHLRIDGDTEDDLLNALNTAARQYAEGFQHRAYITQTWDLWLDAWPEGNHIDIPLPPLRNVSCLKYYGTDDAEYIFSPSDYFIDTKSEPGRLSLGYGKSWPTITLRPANAVLVRFEAGYGEAGDVPKSVKQAMLLLIGHWYENREAIQTGPTGSLSKEVEFAVNALLWIDRVFSF